jgi:hypothetical protein
MGEDLDSQIQTSMVSMTQLLDPFQLESTLEHLAFGGTMNTVKRCTSRGMPQPIRKFEYVNQTENSIDSLLILTFHGTIFQDPIVVAPYVHNGTFWFGFDDEYSIRRKSQYVIDQDLGGAMVWSIDTDDFRNFCGGGTFPLIKVIDEVRLRNLYLWSTNSAC